jgi:hypothetical protein
MDPAQIRAARSQKWRQWSVSMKTLFASNPHHDAKSAADPIP